MVRRRRTRLHRVGQAGDRTFDAGGRRRDVQDGFFDPHPGRRRSPQHTIVHSRDAVYDDVVVIDDPAFGVDRDMDRTVGLGITTGGADRRRVAQRSRPGMQNRHPFPLLRRQRTGVPDVYPRSGGSPVATAEFASNLVRRQSEIDCLGPCDHPILALQQFVECRSHTHNSAAAQAPVDNPNPNCG